jgi:4-hydroxy-2-oxoheptanedioate aldolase
MSARRTGTVLSLPGAVVAELVARHFDVVWIDLEHGALSVRDVQDAVIAVQGSGAEALVRMPLGAAVAPVLDAGADGVVVPRVESVEQAARAVACLHLAPTGTRGYGPRRLAIRPLGQPPACVVQIETMQGVEHADAIAQTPGVDAVVVGCADLTHELGAPLCFDSVGLRAAMDAVGDAAIAAGVVFGVAGLPDPFVPDAARLVIASCDVRIFDAALAGVAARALDSSERSATSR